MIDYNTLIALVQELTTDMPGHTACAGCGYEHDCQNEGCAILRDARTTMLSLYEHCIGNCDCCKHYEKWLHNSEPCKSCERDNWDTSPNWEWNGNENPCSL